MKNKKKHIENRSPLILLLMRLANYLWTKSFIHIAKRIISFDFAIMAHLHQQTANSIGCKNVAFRITNEFTMVR